MSGKEDVGAQRKKIQAVDLFCGAGGLTRGLLDSDIEVCVGVDIDPECEYPYSTNNHTKFMLKSVSDLTATDINEHYDQDAIRVLAGCAPCQTFSTYNQKAAVEDDRWWLLRSFGQLVSDVLPEVVTMENVPGLTNHSVFQEFLQSLRENSYHVSYQVVDCTLYGLPQRRSRLVLLASRLGQIRLLNPEEFGAGQKTVRQTIGDFPSLEAGGLDGEDSLHRSSALSETNLKRIRASVPGGTWSDWPADLVAACHRKSSGKTYRSVYGRMSWDEASPTITTQFYGFGNGRFGHPEQDRALSLREGAALQGFPSNYEFVEPGKRMSFKTIGRLIGNAVPVILGEAIGKSITRHVTEISS